MFRTNVRFVEGAIMIDVYKKCPVFEDSSYTLRMVTTDDCLDLLKVYSDVKAVPLFNSDNCGGDDFYYTTESRMTEAIKYWLWEYGRQGFVRWAIVDNCKKEVIGTIELFHREANDYFTNCGLLRLDLRSDYENATDIQNILSLILEPSFELFDCDKIATKAIPEAKERIKALSNMGFVFLQEKLIGHDGTNYKDYFIFERKKT